MWAGARRNSRTRCAAANKRSVASTLPYPSRCSARRPRCFRTRLWSTHRPKWEKKSPRPATHSCFPEDSLSGPPNLYCAALEGHRLGLAAFCGPRDGGDFSSRNATGSRAHRVPHTYPASPRVRYQPTRMGLRHARLHVKQIVVRFSPRAALFSPVAQEIAKHDLRLFVNGH